MLLVEHFNTHSIVIKIKKRDRIERELSHNLSWNNINPVTPTSSPGLDGIVFLSDCGYYIWIDYNPDSFNWPPLGSPSLVAPSHVNSGEEYCCSFSSVDPEENQHGYQGQVYYNFSFGDSTYSGWQGPYKSGEKCSVFHAWNKSGLVDVKVKARDDPNGDGDFSDGAETYWMP